MKLLALFFACTFLLPTTIHAGAVKELYTNAEEQIEFFYQSGGEWNLVKINDMDFAYKESAEFITLAAKTTIQNIETSKRKKEICLVSFVSENQEFHSINCF